MQYTRLGGSGLEVSRICLGCMGFGEPDRGAFRWALREDDARPVLKQALDSGVTFFDTANVYSAGTSEEVTGKVLLSLATRDELVIATKVWGRMRPGPNGAGLSRKAIMTEIEASLRRLGTDYVDLYQIHRWDDATPIEETLEALHDVVKAGKVRYLGASSMAAWQLSKALYLADRHDWTRFVGMQNYYSLVYREEEREMLPLCLDQGVGAIPWKPLAAGRLAREWDTATTRSGQDGSAERYFGDRDRPIVDAVGKVAAERGATRAQVALAWLLAQPAVTAPIVGATRAEHVIDVAAATEVELSGDEIRQLQEAYTPREVLGY